MNSKELIKKIDIGRVGNGSVSYNDMCLILNKEETLEHLQYIEQLEKENQELKEKLDGIPLEYDGYLYFTKSISNVVKENKKLKKALDILKNKVVNIHQLLKTTFIVYNSLALLLGYDKLTQEEYELLKEVLEEE